jgi:transcription elongation factor Elf1
MTYKETEVNKNPLAKETEANKNPHAKDSEANRNPQYKCPACKNAITITDADFIKGIAMTSCGDCGRNAFTIEDVQTFN